MWRALFRGRHQRRNPDRAAPAVRAGEALLQDALEWFRAGDDARAEAELSRALAHDAAIPEAHYWMARLCYRSGRLQEAIEAVRRARLQDAEHLEAWILEAVCRAHAGDLGIARRALDRALILGRTLPPERVVHGPRPDLGDRRDGVVARLERAVRGNPAYADLRLELGTRLADAGRTRESLVQLEHALQLNPGFVAARLQAARTLLRMRRPLESCSHLLRALACQPRYPDLWLWLGYAQLRAGRPLRASRALGRAVALHREYSCAHRLLALAHHSMGRTAAALGAARSGLLRDRSVPSRGLESEAALRAVYPDLECSRGRERQRVGDLDGAWAAYASALVLRPGLAVALLALARLDLEQGRFEAAGSRLEELVRHEPDWADARALLGRTWLLRGEPRTAEARLREAIRIQPGYAAARADLGWALLAQDRRADADEEFARALELDPASAAPRQQLAWRETRLRIAAS